jgi:beta-aspartyl-peptidase (threonine type)
MSIGLVVHGGAGDIEPHEHAERIRACRAAVEAAWGPLRDGGTALDAVEIATRVLENHPLLNAGYGSAPNRDGVIELDAMIMDGRTHKIGAVAAVQRIANPISLSRYVMERTPHHLLVGPGAEQFAAEQGFPLVDQANLWANREKYVAATEKPKAGDTVGAVALDKMGNIAVAVSTGGLSGKLPGRVGDSPIAGAGGYADNQLGAACSTGVGEGIIRALLTFRAVELLTTSDNAQEAAERALAIFGQRFEGIGGLIMLDRSGGIGIAHNTRFMPTAYILGDHIGAQVTGQGTRDSDK